MRAHTRREEEGKRYYTRREEVLSWKSQCPPFCAMLSWKSQCPPFCAMLYTRVSYNDLSELRGGDGRMGSLFPFLPFQCFTLEVYIVSFEFEWLLEIINVHLNLSGY